MGCIYAAATRPTHSEPQGQETKIEMTFPEKLLSERQRLGLTQAGAAALLDISKSALEKWEAGIKTPLALTQEGALARLRVAGKRGPGESHNARCAATAPESQCDSWQEEHRGS